VGHREGDLDFRPHLSHLFPCANNIPIYTLVSDPVASSSDGAQSIHEPKENLVVRIDSNQYDLIKCTMSEWVDYYRALENRQPRQLFQDWQRIWEASRGKPGFAIDLGCGDGTETLVLLAHGWHVLAVDSTPEAIEWVIRRTPEEDRPRLQVQVVAFQQARFPPANLIYAGLSLPFCPPEDLPPVWRKIRSALKPGGHFVGHFFGVRDSWAGKPDMNFLTAGQARSLLDGLAVERFQEFERDEPTVFEAVKRKHYFEVIVRREGETGG